MNYVVALWLRKLLLVDDVLPAGLAPNRLLLNPIKTQFISLGGRRRLALDWPFLAQRCHVLYKARYATFSTLSLAKKIVWQKIASLH